MIKVGHAGIANSSFRKQGGKPPHIQILVRLEAEVIVASSQLTQLSGIGLCGRSAVEVSLECGCRPSYELIQIVKVALAVEIEVEIILQTVRIHPEHLFLLRIGSASNTMSCHPECSQRCIDEKV